MEALIEDALEFDPTLFPRTYRISAAWRLGILTCSALLTLGGLFGLVYVSLTGTLVGWAAAFLTAFFGVFALLGLYGVLYPLQYRVTLAVEAIEVIEPFRRRRLTREEIKGRRLLPPNQGISVLVLVPEDARKKSLKISLVLKTDDVFAVWFHDIPDVDVQAAFESEVELAQTLHPGLSPEEQEREIKRLRRRATAMNGATIALSAWGFVSPSPGLLLIAALMALPWLAIVLVAKFQPLYRFGAPSGDQHPDLSLTLIAPGFILMLRALSSFETLDWQVPVVLACASGLALGGAAALVDPWFRKQRVAALLTILLTCAYGYGGSVELNALVDKSVPRSFPTTVLSKRVDGDWKWKTWYLTLKPWGSRREDDDVSVSEAQYQRTQPGNTVCVLLRSGALRIAWYQVADCN
jgi:hypothetical protein